MATGSSITVLVGNGLSIAVNDALRLERLTEDGWLGSSSTTWAFGPTGCTSASRWKRGPAAGVWEVRYEPRSAHTGEAAPEPGKWVIMLPDGGVHFARAEEGRASTLRPPLEMLLGPEVADEVFGQLPRDW